MGQSSRQRGNVALYLLFSLAASVAVGYGVYVLLRERRSTAAGESGSESVEAEPAGRPVPRPMAPEPTPAVAPPPDLIEPDAAERAAVAPDIGDVDKDAVLLGTPGTSDNLDPAQVERTIKRYTVRYERCMRRAKERGEQPRGELRVTIVIAADGSVDFATGQPTNLSDELATCIVDVIHKLRFDRPSDGMKAKVVYPMAIVTVPAGSDPLER